MNPDVVALRKEQLSIARKQLFVHSQHRTKLIKLRAKTGLDAVNEEIARAREQVVAAREALRLALEEA